VPLPGRWLRIALVLGAFIGMADATVVAVALEPMSRHFNVSLASSQAVLAVYLITVTATLPVFGRLGDRYGRRGAYVTGFAVFAVGSVVAALAPTFASLIAGRVLQALGGALLTSGSLALITQHANRRITGRSVALLVVAQAVAGLVGPPAGGLLVALGGWQAVFWAGVPLALAGAVLTLATVPAARGERSGAEIDLPGAIGLAALLLGLGAGISSLSGPALGGWDAWRWFVVAGAGGLLLAAVEPRARRPVLDPHLLRGRFAAASVATFLSTGSLMSCFALLPFWLEGAHGASAGLAGAAFIPIAVGVGATSRRAGRLGDLGRTRSVTVGGMLLAGAGLGLAALTALTSWWVLLPIGMLVLGCGNGLFSSPNTAAAMTVAPRSALSSAAGFLSTARSAGVILGLGATGAAYTFALRSGGREHVDSVVAVLFGCAGAICLVVAVLASQIYRAAGAEPASGAVEP
jgi:MFS family permease